MTDPTPLPERIAALVALMRADPEATAQAFHEVKILQPAIRNATHCHRLDLTGVWRFIAVDRTGTGSWGGNFPDGCSLLRNAGESGSDFIARLEAAWIADGWILL